MQSADCLARRIEHDSDLVIDPDLFSLVAEGICTRHISTI
jgi:hypothetical protein